MRTMKPGKCEMRNAKCARPNASRRLSIAPFALPIFLLLLLPACKAHRQYPDLTPGWHNADYTKVFGRIQRVAQTDPAAKPVWIIRYGYSDNDPYSGKLNLYPDGALAGYSGGELVEIKGALSKEYTLPNFPGTWYKVDEIRMWSTQSAR